MKDYIRINNEITKKSLDERRGSPSIINAHMQRHEEEFKLFNRHVSDNTKSILDIGCKDGLWLEVLRSNGFGNIVATDTCPEAAQEARNRGFDVIECDAQDMVEIESESFDSITILHTLEHVPSP